eukprot:10420624-Alexandrium_andersonii.AAC.1
MVPAWVPWERRGAVSLSTRSLPSAKFEEGIVGSRLGFRWGYLLDQLLRGRGRSCIAYVA